MFTAARSRSAWSRRSRPWNFPLNIPSRKLGPALAAGNGVVFKPSEVTPLLGQRLVEALLEAGVPGGALALVHGHAEVGKAMVTDNRVDAVTFTGSTEVGEAIHRNVARRGCAPSSRWAARTRSSCWTDADLDRAADIVAKGAFGLSGQACTGTSRVVVHEAVLNGLLDRVMERAREVVLGDGLEPAVTMGPLASAGAAREVPGLPRRSAAQGAASGDAAVSAAAPEGGYFVRPAIFTGVDPDSRLAQEEVFAPILAFLTVQLVRRGGRGRQQQLATASRPAS